MKTFYSCFVLVLLTVCTQQASAQNADAVNNQIVESELQRQRDMFMFEKNNSVNFQYNYLVTMKDNAQLIVRSKIYADTARHKTYLVLVDKKYGRTDTNRNRKIYVSQTLSIARRMGSGGSDKKWYKGMAIDSCWMFKAISGNINAYSAFSEDGLGLTPPPLIAIQRGEGPIIKLTADNLKQMVGQDADALENIQKKDYYKAIKKYNRNAAKTAKK